MFPVTFAASATQLALINGYASTCGQDGQIATGVTDIASGKPIANARVQLSGPIAVAWHTDAEGTLRFLKMPTGNYKMTVLSPGYATIETPVFNVDCTNAANLEFKLAAIPRSGASKRAGAHGKAAASAVTVGSRSRLPHRSVARAAGRHAVCVTTQSTGHAEQGHRLLTTRRTRRSLICSK